MVGAAVLVVVAAVAVKMTFFPSVDEKYFQTKSNTVLQHAPPGHVIVRPTHFAKSPTNGIVAASVKGARWMVGRNVSFNYFIALAYAYNLGRIALPPNPPKGNFDFLVTMPNDPEPHLQAAIKKKLGYTAQKEMRDTDVFALKVKDASLPGLKVSTATQQDISEKNGRLYFTHMQLSTLATLLEQVLKSPVVDKTGLTDFYDFSLVWDAQTQRMIQTGAMDNDTGKKILADWGLGLEPDTASVEMLVVKKTD